MIIILGVRVAAERVAQICGPLWGAEVLHNFYLVFLFPAIFLLVTMLLQGLSWTWLDDTLFKKGKYKILQYLGRLTGCNIHGMSPSTLIDHLN